VQTPAPDLGHASPIWTIILLAIVGGPVIWAIVYGIRHRDSGAPDKEHLLDATTEAEVARYRANMRPPSGGHFRG